jgi:hypothetical protein
VVPVVVAPVTTNASPLKRLSEIPDHGHVLPMVRDANGPPRRHNRKHHGVGRVRGKHGTRGRGWTHGKHGSGVSRKKGHRNEYVVEREVSDHTAVNVPFRWSQLVVFVNSISTGWGEVEQL